MNRYCISRTGAALLAQGAATCAGDDMLTRARGHVAGMMAARNLADDSPVLLPVAHLTTAARPLCRLSEQRLTRVILVTR